MIREVWWAEIHRSAKGGSGWPVRWPGGGVCRWTAPCLKHSDGVAGRPRAVGDSEGEDAYQELPAVALPAGDGEAFEVGVVEDPEPEGYYADLVDGVFEAFVAGWLDVVAASDLRLLRLPRG